MKEIRRRNQAHTARVPIGVTVGIPQSASEPIVRQPTITVTPECLQEEPITFAPKVWRNNITELELTETGERRGEIVVMRMKGGGEYTIHSDLLGNGEWRLVRP